jgi:uncharacterized protein
VPPADRAPRGPPRQASCRGALGVDQVLASALASALAVLLAAAVKGAIGFGFPTLGTPLLALVVDVKAAVVLLIVPNIVMDGLQARRRGDLVPAVRRFASLVAFGAAGTVLGTRLLAILSPRTATIILGVTVVVFVVMSAARWTPHVRAEHERWLNPLVGFVAGVIGGVTNVPGTPLVMYFYALGLAKHDFVRAVAVTFVLYKLVQLGAVAWYGLLTWPLLGLSALLTLVALVGFRGGLAIQDRLDQRAFNRVVLVALGALGAGLIVRAAF